MVRLSSLPPDVATGWLNTQLPQFDSTPWVSPLDLKTARVAIVSTAGLHRRSDQKFGPGAADYRLIPGDVDYADLMMSHTSVNLDRTAFQQDVNVVFPLELLRELVRSGEVGEVADWHYAFNGATDPTRLLDSGTEVGRLLKAASVTAALLVPV